MSILGIDAAKIGHLWYLSNNPAVANFETGKTLPMHDICIYGSECTCHIWLTLRFHIHGPGSSMTRSRICCDKKSSCRIPVSDWSVLSHCIPAECAPAQLCCHCDGPLLLEECRYLTFTIYNLSQNMRGCCRSVVEVFGCMLRTDSVSYWHPLSHMNISRVQSFRCRTPKPQKWHP